jgi:hypothetical protein
VRLSVLLALVSLAAGGALVLLAEFGRTPQWLLAVLLVWLATAGLPTVIAVVGLAGVWPGPSLPVFLLAATVLAMALQHATVASALWLWGVLGRRTFR